MPVIVTIIGVVDGAGLRASPRLWCKLRGLPGSTAADISEAPPCTFYRLITGYLTGAKNALCGFLLWGGPCACCLHLGFFVAFLLRLKHKYSLETPHLCVQRQLGQLLSVWSPRNVDSLLFGRRGIFNALNLAVGFCWEPVSSFMLVSDRESFKWGNRGAVWES